MGDCITMKPLAPIAGGNESILVADDEENVLRLLVDLLESQGYRVLTARDGAEAIALLESRRNAIDLVVLDLFMPNVTGMEVVTHLRNSAPHLPILISTGFGTAAIDPETLSLGHLVVLEKPYSPYEFIRSVRDLLDQRPPAGGS